jgi:hypothetical protein
VIGGRELVCPVCASKVIIGLFFHHLRIFSVSIFRAAGLLKSSGVSRMGKPTPSADMTDFSRLPAWARSGPSGVYLLIWYENSVLMKTFDMPTETKAGATGAVSSGG